MLKQPIHPLRTWRLDRGYSLGEAAKCVGTIRQTWLDWETRRRIPGQEYMTKVYRVTGGTVGADQFYWPDGYPGLTGELPDFPNDPAGGKRDDVGRTLEAVA